VEQALDRIKAQMTDEERIRRSRVILNTDCAIEATRSQIDEEWDRLQGRLSAAAATGQAGSGQEEA
jgi:dephospho-CoA kinase